MRRPQVITTDEVLVQPFRGVVLLLDDGGVGWDGVARLTREMIGDRTMQHYILWGHWPKFNCIKIFCLWLQVLNKTISFKNVLWVLLNGRLWLANGNESCHLTFIFEMQSKEVFACSFDEVLQSVVFTRTKKISRVYNRKFVNHFNDFQTCWSLKTPSCLNINVFL